MITHKQLMLASRDAYNTEGSAFITRTMDDEMIVAFRGTLPPSLVGNYKKIIEDWYKDTEADLIDVGFGKFHQGFLYEFLALKNHIVIPDTIKRVYFTGHSKGGALAVIAAHYFYQKISDCVTFGSPMAGSEYQQFITNYEYLNDPIPHFFKRPRGYVRSGDLVYIDDKMNPVADSMALTIKRKYNLIKAMFLNPDSLLECHSIGPTGGYSRFFDAVR